MIMVKKPQKERVDKIKNKAKVIAKVIANPLATQEQIAKDAWVWIATVNRNMKELEENGIKSKAIEKIIEQDAKIINLAQSIFVDRMENAPDKISNRDLISASDISAKRYSIFKWEATNKEWWLKEIKNITINVIWNGSTV